VHEHQTRSGCQDGSASPDNIAMRAAALQVNKADLLCDFCKMKGHDEEHCFAKRDARAAAHQKAAKRRLTRRTNKKGGQQHAQEAAAIPSTIQSVSMAHAGELALDVSSPDLNGPPLLSPVDPSADWNANTGATCHMTPHRHWFTSYKPHKIPIRLADSKVIWSAGVGSVRFLPQIGGQPGRLLKFERVLHVPDLRSNLLSVLYLTRERGFSVLIDCNTLSFC
jgi:hypothetical protein